MKSEIRLWFIRETAQARLYSKTPPGRDPDLVWIPKSIIEHTSKEPSGLHIVTLPDWFTDKNGV